MTPSYRHRFIAPSSGTRIELTWSRGYVPFKQRLRDGLREFLFGGEPRHSPKRVVDSAAFATIVRGINTNPEAAAASFRNLGYSVDLVPAASR